MGCQQSVPTTSTAGGGAIQSVGQTERMISRSAKLHKKLHPNSNNNKSPVENAPSTTSTTTSLSIDQLNILPKLDGNGNLLPEEVVRRTDSSIVTKTVLLGTPQERIQVQYAHWTQRGYYPDDPHKENQDAYSIHAAPFASCAQDAMFAVYDGHGQHGHDCARFAQKKLPAAVAKFVKQQRVQKYTRSLEANHENKKKLFDPEKWPLLTKEEYMECCRKAFWDVNRHMNAASSVQDKMSGTTALTVNFHGSHMIVCNVGDCRAVLGHWVSKNQHHHHLTRGTNPQQNGNNDEEEKTEIEPDESDIPDPITAAGAAGAAAADNGISKSFPYHDNNDDDGGGTMLAIPLSRDQTPYRKDERERVKRHGADVMSIDQKEGHEEMHENWGDMVLGQEVDIHGDPPRVWVKGQNYPGAAFTRSLGDRIAKDIGVTAEPEMLSTQLTSNDHVLVIASDGIFEFLSNQEVINICVKSESPIIACEKLVKAAYDQWLVYERRTDDITVIVCFLDVDKPPPSNGTTIGTTEDLIEFAKTAYGVKPIRKKKRSIHDNLSETNFESQ